MLSKGKGTAPCSAHTSCPSSEATAPGDAGVGDEADPSLPVSIPSVSQVHLHCAGDQRSCCCTRGRICLSWNLGNAADACSIQHLSCKSRCCSCNNKSPFCRIHGKKRQEPSPGLPSVSILSTPTHCSAMQRFNLAPPDPTFTPHRSR